MPDQLRDLLTNVPNSDFEEMSNSATFSYAQAAKGQSAAQSVGSQSSTTQSQAPSTTSTQSRDAAPTPSTRAPSVAISTTSNELDGSQNTRSSSVKPDCASLNGNDSDILSTSDKAAELSNLPIQAAEKVLGDNVPQPAERRGRGQTLTSQATDASDGKKSRKGKKGKTAEKESDQDVDQGRGQDKKENVPPKVELSEAPVPAVNVWTQRQAARAAKVKTTPSASTPARGSNNTGAGQTDGAVGPVSQEYKSKASQNDGIDATVAQSKSLPAGARPPKKDVEQSRGSGGQAPRKGASRGTPGPVASNTLSWPTPETAANGSKPLTTEKAERIDKDEKDESGPSKPRGKDKWLPVPFVPSVTFETPIPTRSSRGGRINGTRGGRDTAIRGNHGNSASTDRTQENGTTTGVSSAPLSSKRASVDVSASRDTRKAQSQAGSGKVLGDFSSTSAKIDASKQSPVDLSHGVSSQHTPARSMSSNQRTDESVKMSPTPRDNGVHNAKDSSFQGQSNSSRNDRIRGNTRGRGGHSALNGIPHPQSQFSQNPVGYNYSANANSRQPNHSYAASYGQMPYGQPYPISTTSNHRSRPSSGNNRSRGSAGHQSSRPSSYPIMGMPYDPALYPQAGPFVPYPADPNHILHVVLSQVEYYFSIDNLCKDYYLRKFMDSQGFVPLSIIASFKRMQEIAQDYQLIRIACDSSPHIEFIVTEDGHDKVRRREKWEHWVLEKSMRHPTAQHDGPVGYRPFDHRMTYWPQVMPYVGDAAPMFAPNTIDNHFAHNVNGGVLTSPTSNGVNGHPRPADSQLSAAVPEFSPTVNFGMGGASQPDLVPSGSVDGGLATDNIPKKNNMPSSSEQASFLPNGSQKLESAEKVDHDGPVTNGINGHHETEGC
ncbi:uncharacterized protein GGS25DRAFT_520593 [Hypoxylon fragiforme]|uniref:uncharacterized protein n=1 Tax=Hypoxylon fragiforme TaxID=63214 RepID=UPI0020C6E9C1|nr:uncharacterized protein GGS25DRAFT_520593 [Hypoxylon fragiforme]KAI2609786.1 hypothetical protein GGS25DRAFT_520593 [Hypoxylon fragiforme]